MSEKHPIKSGWRGNLNGVVEATDGTSIQVSEIEVKLDMRTAWALCSLLDDRALERAKPTVENPQIPALSNLGAAIGRLIDHPAANNGGRNLLK